MHTAMPLKHAAPQRLLCLAPALLVGLALGACTTYVPRVAPSMSCELPATLTTACDAPGSLQTFSGELTYRELITIAQADRQRLVKCGVQQQDLAKAVEACRSAIAAHNAELEKINQDNQKGGK